MPFVTGTTASSGDNTLIAAPGAGLHIVVQELSIQNEAATANTVILKDGATGIWRQLLQSQGQALNKAPTMPPLAAWELQPNNAFVLNLSAATSVGYSILYSVR